MFQGCFARMLDFIDEYYWAIMGLCLGVGVAMVRNDVTVYQHCHCLLLSLSIPSTSARFTSAQY